MVKRSTFLYFSLLLLLVIAIFPYHANGQLNADLSTTDNTNCSGSPCDYNGPSILINELMMSPSSNDGSMWGSNTGQRGEWIELYNPNICESIDISCYFLGNNASDSDPYPGGYLIPPGTVIPPAGFAMIRGLNAPAVPAELLVENGGNVVERVVDGTGVCIGGGSRLWFPNVGGWFAFYDANGVPQDAVSWANQSNLDEFPCVPSLTGCTFSGPLSNYTNFPNDRKNYILNTNASDYQGQSIRRIPDGGTWSGPDSPTYATCNAACVNPQTNNCTGTATASPQGGTPPYTYLWDDPQGQMTQTADQLCAGDYCVTITDANNATVTQCITVEDYTYTQIITDTICVGASYTLPDNSVVTQAGVYPVVLQTGAGCDSSITVDLEVYPEYSFELNPQICANESYTLPDGTEVSTTGTYQVAYQSIVGCDSIYTINLTVSSPIGITVDASICEGDNYTLPDGTLVSDEDQYEILVPGGPASCDTLFTVNLSFYPDFEIQVDAANAITCFGEIDGEISLSINGSSDPYAFDWSDGQDHAAHATGLEAGQYSVEVSDANGCKADTSLQIDEPPVVSISASADTLICFGSQSELEAQASGGTGDFEYHWSHTSSSAENSTVSPTENGTYTVFAADENGCSTDTISLDVAVINMFADSLQVFAGDPVCAGGEVSVAADYNGAYPPYSYSWSQGLPDDPGPFGVSPAQSTSYFVMVSDTCGNQVAKDIPVEIWPLPTLAIDSILNVSCFGADDAAAQLSVSEGTPGYAYTWSDGIDHAALGEDLAAGLYTVEVSDANDCTGAVSFVITEPQPLEIALSADSVLCPGEQTELIAAATGGTPVVEYHWSHTTALSGNSVIQATADTVFSVFAEDANGCTTDTMAQEIDVVTMAPGLLSIANDTAICPGQSALLFGAYSGDYPPYTYSWSDGLGTQPGPFSVSPDTTETYQLSVSDYCNNALTATVEVLLYENPEVTLPDELYAGCSPLEVELFDSIYAESDYIHEWQFANGNSIFGNPAMLTLNETGLYQLSLLVTSPEGCSAESDNTIPLEVYESPRADFTASPWSTSIDEPGITFSDISEGSVFTNWTIDNTQFENQNEVTYAFSDTGSYAIELRVENEFGCRDSIIKPINITIDHTVKIPNGFLPTDPGGDPYYESGNTSNTIFYPFAEYVVDYQMSIFNRWGELIFESSELEKGWNGTYRDKPCPQDVYVYKIELEYIDGERVTKVGDITLFR